MQKIKLSIVIPAYNAENSIEKCLNSIIKQIAEKTEVIIINDGSTDKTEEVIKKYLLKNKNIKYVKQENKGVSFTRNKGIDIAEGEYIWFIDSDDYISDDALEIIFKNLNDNDLIFLNYNLIGQEKKEILNFFDRKELPKEEFLSLLRNNLFTIDMTVPWNKIFKKNIIVDNNIKFEEKLYSNEDFLFDLNYYIKLNNVLIIKNNLYNYVVNQEISLSKRKRSLEYSWDVTKKLYRKVCLLYANEPLVCNNFLFERCYNDMMCSEFKAKDLKIIFNDRIFTKEVFLTRSKNKKSIITKYMIKFKLPYIMALLVYVKKKIKR